MEPDLLAIPEPHALARLGDAVDTQYLQGYQLYFVEQWACARRPVWVVTTYTGDASHNIRVWSVELPDSSSAPRVQKYLEAASFHSRKRKTEAGLLFLTNLGGFPSELTTVLIPDGDASRHRSAFIVNENLRRLGCSGRAGLTLSRPADATQAKFIHQFRIADVDFQSAVIELVRFCQLALVTYGLLDREYTDGLLCDYTEKALARWRTEYDYLDVEDVPSSVAALLGLLIGARNRLRELGYNVPKDVFDSAAFECEISHYQKHTKLQRTGKLDRRTLDQLHRDSAKAVSGDGWHVSKGLKRVGGKPGEMVSDLVRSKKRTAVETTDMEKFAASVKGDSAKWLWQGKKRPEEYDLKKTRTDKSEEPDLRRGVLNRVTDRLSDARTGLSKFKGAVRREPRRREEQVDCPKAATPRSYTPEPSAGRQSVELQKPLMDRRHSFTQRERRHEARWPRSVSFSLAEDAIYGESTDLWSSVEKTRQLEIWLMRNLRDAQEFDNQLGADAQELLNGYEQASYEWITAKQATDRKTADEEETLVEAVKEVELLGAKLEYEIGVLRSRVHDIEYSVHNFANQVDAIEHRAVALEPSRRSDGWMRWGVRFFFGIGD